MKKKLMILLVMVTFVSTVAYARGKENSFKVPMSTSLPESMKIISQSSQANKTVITAVDLSNNELVIIYVGSYGYSEHSYSCSRTGVIMDPNQPTVQGESRPFVDQD